MTDEDASKGHWKEIKQNNDDNKTPHTHFNPGRIMPSISFVFTLDDLDDEIWGFWADDI